MLNNFLDFFNSNSDAITSISAIIIAGLAVYGIREWKRQIRGKTDYEIARRYLRVVLNLRDSLMYVRNPFISLAEMESALKQQGFETTEIQNNTKTNIAVYATRWKKVQEALTNFEAELLEAEVSSSSSSVFSRATSSSI